MCGSSEFREFIPASLYTRQTYQDSPTNNSWGATANAAIRTYECTCNGTCRVQMRAATILSVEGSPCTRLTSPSCAAAASSTVSRAAYDGGPCRSVDLSEAAARDARAREDMARWYTPSAVAGLAWTRGCATRPQRRAPKQPSHAACQEPHAIAAGESNPSTRPSLSERCEW